MYSIPRGKQMAYMGQDCSSLSLKSLKHSTTCEIKF